MNTNKICLAAAEELSNMPIEEVMVVGSTSTFNRSEISEAIHKQQSSIINVNALIDNLPGVSVNKGDTYGFDDWPTNNCLRRHSQRQLPTHPFRHSIRSIFSKFTADRYVDLGNSWITDAYLGINLEDFSPALQGANLNLAINNLLNEGCLGSVVSG
ncbi:hypothetical protein ACJJIF_08115 [Microbulbifer sp. SSSA002]|uniref:hypothetical protein n=1 Tax=unclassified Microbulbifer TaxID=2619833 RepID=UPI00403A707F